MVKAPIDMYGLVQKQYYILYELKEHEASVWDLPRQQAWQKNSDFLIFTLILHNSRTWSSILGCACPTL